MSPKRNIPPARYLLLTFFLIMLTCTIISRIYDSITIPKVLTTATKRKSVETIIEGTGTVKVKNTKYYTPLPGLRIFKAPLTPGSEVQAGQVLFQYDLSSMQERKEALEREISGFGLEIEKVQISQENTSNLTQTELASWELALAQRELEEGNLKLEDTRKECEAELERLEEEYQDSMDLIEEELWQQQDQEQENARQSLDSVKKSRDRELKAAQRKVEDLTEKLDQALEEDGNYQELERELERAEEDLADLSSSWDDQVEAARFQMEALDSQEERIREGKTTAQESRRNTYEGEVKEQEQRIRDAQEENQSLAKAVEKAAWQLAVAQKQDGEARLSEEQNRRILALTIKGIQLDMEEKQRQLKGLEELIGQEGEVRALEDGIVAEMELTEGKTASGEERVTLAVGEGLFEGTFLKEEQELMKGDPISISIPGTARKKEAVISNLNLFEDTEGVFQAELSDLELPFGAMCHFTCRKQSEIFPKVIPLAGLRKDMEGYYCLIARTRTSILGEEFRAERVDVELLYLGSNEAAVEGSIFEEDMVIVGENKGISAGSRVRPVAGF